MFIRVINLLILFKIAIKNPGNYPGSGLMFLDNEFTYPLVNGDGVNSWLFFETESLESKYEKPDCNYQQSYSKYRQQIITI